MAAREFLPSSAPFSAEERERLDGVLADARPIQRAWLAGFLAGMDVQGHAAALAPAATGTPLTIVFATESGNSESLAHKSAKLARRHGFRPQVLDFATLDLSTFAPKANLIVVAATWGEGEPPARSVRNFGILMGDEAPRFDGIHYAVLGLGDTSYAEFCAVGRQFDAKLKALGGIRWCERLDCDLDFEEPAAAWIEAALQRFKPLAAIEAVPSVQDEVSPGLDATAEVIEHINLNSSRSEKETIHLALSFDHGSPAYEPGDSLEIFAENDPILVDEVLAATGKQGNAELRQALALDRDITTLSTMTADRFAKATANPAIQGLIDAGEIRSWIRGRQFIDLLISFPASLTAQQIIDITRKLPPRAYSIASSRKEVGAEAHLLIAAVRYESHGRKRSGVASTYVADRLRLGARMKVRLKQNKRFRLPADPATDIVMIGAGTGVAPFRAFVQERRAIGATGRSWLFFGDRHFTHDFLYQLEWQEALEEGSLSRIDVAFSRDQPEKIYVQDRIRAHRRDLVEWLDGGANIYVCGDAKAMAKDVRAAVVDAFAAVKAISAQDADRLVAALEQAGRYQQDVY